MKIIVNYDKASANVNANVNANASHEDISTEPLFPLLEVFRLTDDN